MRRREFLTVLGGAAAAWPLAARAQPGKLPTIGFLGTSTRSVWVRNVASFEQRLHELGWIEDRNLAIEYRWAEGREERYSEIAAEFVKLKVDVIVTSGGAVGTVRRATSIIPIVFAVANHPLGTGLVASLARSGGNVTGLSNQASDLDAKRLELLREVVPNLHSLAIMANVGYPAAVLEMGAIKTNARKLGLDVTTIEIRRAEDIASGITALKGHAEALYVVTDPLVASNRIAINTLALDARLPTMHSVRDNVETGGPHLLIVFTSGGDPIKLGLVASLNRPGGNVTGVSNLLLELGSKQLGLLRELVPAITAVALLINPNFPGIENQLRDVEAAARKLGLELIVLRAGTTDREIDTAFAKIAQQDGHALVVGVDPSFLDRRDHIIALAARHAIPAIYPVREFAVAGGLMSYGTDFADAYRQAGVYTGRIVRGEKPADLPVQRSTKFEFVINLKTAKTLSLTVPNAMQLLADEVIE